jgi:hypothetical protein
MVIGTEPRMLKVAPDSELGSLLREAAATGQALLVDTGEAVYALNVFGDEDDETPRVSRSDRYPSAEQVARSIAGIRKAAGSWKDVDIEAFTAYIRERRRTSSRPPVRL